MKKRVVWLLAIGIIIILLIYLFPTKRQRLNRMWKAALDSQKGSYSVYMKIQDGEDIMELLGEYEYENRSDDFYYKKTDYNIEPDGTRKQNDRKF